MLLAPARRAIAFAVECLDGGAFLDTADELMLTA